MKTRKLMLWITAFLPLLGAAIAYPKLPEIIPIHWGLDGEVNGTAPRTMIFLLGVISILITGIMMIAAKYDNNMKKQDQRQILHEINIVVNVMLFACMCCTVVEALHPGTLDIGCFVTLFVGMVFTFLGNKLPKMRPNRFMGVRTKHTLNDAEVWSRTARFSGWLMFLCGIIIMISAFVLPAVIRFTLLATLVIVMNSVIYFMAYRYGKQMDNK